MGNDYLNQYKYQHIRNQVQFLTYLIEKTFKKELFSVILFINSIFYGKLTESCSNPLYAIFLVITSILFSLFIGFVLKKISPIVFR